ncbi:MAG: HEAT repeat domain-containing protein [Nannocystaceae bacterium]
MLPALLALALAAAPGPTASTGGAAAIVDAGGVRSVSKDRSDRAPGSTANAKKPATAKKPAAEDASAAARDAVARGRLDHYGDPPLADRARAAGLDAASLTRLLDDLAARCPSPAQGACTALSSEPALRPLVDALGAIGTRADAPVLLRLEAHGVWAANGAIESILTREMASAVTKARCAPPSADEIARARADLGGFLVVRDRGGRRVAEAPTAAEADDLAYFLAAVASGGPEVGAAEEQPGGGASIGAPPQGPDPEAQRLAEAIQGARASGDVDAIARSSRAYLERLGFPGPIDAAAERTWAWGGARFSYVLRDLAEASELRGDHVVADQLYRRANPGGGMCGTTTSSRWADQVQGAIRSSEQRGDCRLAVAERLLDIDGPTRAWSKASPAEDYGPSRLAAAGFDVPRLYRGALLTIHRDDEVDALRTILGNAPAPLRDAALARLERRGPEAWERRVHAIEGLADTSGRAGIQRLLGLLEVTGPELRPRILAAIGALAARPETDPCDPDVIGLGGMSFGSQWERQVSALGETCERSLRLADAAAVARAVTPWLSNGDPETREAAAVALGKIGHRAALPALRKRRGDPYRPTDVLRCDDVDHCHRFYPVREAVAEAIKSIARLSKGDKAWRREAGPATPAAER